jgi:thiol-disulfide isomerase/thioredoxin
MFSSILAPGAWGGKDESAEDQLKRGTEALAARDYQQAVKLFEQANKTRHKSCGPCYQGLADAYMALGDSGKQLENANKALQCSPDAQGKAKAHESKGNAFLRLGKEDPRKLKDGEEEFRTAAQLDRSNPTFQLEVGIALLKQSHIDEGKQELNALLESTPVGLAAEAARSLIADPRRVGEPFAPDFQVTTIQGENLELSKLAGKVVVLDFWATWCPPCVAGVPELQALVKKYPRDQLVLISISADRNEQQWRTFIAKKQMEWAQYWDSDHRIIDLFGIRAFPTYLVIDKGGVIRQRVVGTNPKTSVASRLKPILKALLQPNTEG